MNIEIFSNQILLELIECLFLFIQMKMLILKRFKARRYYLPKGIIINYNVIINGKNFDVQQVDSDIKRNEEIKKLTAGQGEGYTTGCLLDYDYIKNQYGLIAVDLSRQKELDAHPKAIQQMEFVGQLNNNNSNNNSNNDNKDNDNDNNNNNNNDNNVETMFILTILEKINETRLKFSQGSVTVL